MRALLYITIAASLSNYVYSARILGLFPHTGKSHQMVFEPLLKTLAERGHHVTSVSFFPLQNPPANYTDVSLEGIAQLGVETMDLQIYEKPPGFIAYLGEDVERMVKQTMEFAPLVDMALNVCRKLVNWPALTSALKKDYDLVLVENFNSDCMLGLAHVYGIKAPIVALLSSGMMPWSPERIGLSDNPSYVPLVSTSFRDKMTFLERLENTLLQVYFKWWYRLEIQVKEQEIIEKHFGRKITDLSDLGKNVSLMLLNTFHGLNGARPLLPGVVEVGGMHLDQNRKTIPPHIEKFLNESSEGVVLFSFGSLIKTASIPKYKEEIIVNALSKLKQRVLWKYEDSDEKGTITGNIMRVKWIPQLELLTTVEVSLCFSDVGKWDLPLSGELCRFTLAKSLFKDSRVIVTIGCDNAESNLTVSYQWEQAPCSPDYFHYFEKRIVVCTKPPDDAGNKTMLSNPTGVRKIACQKKHSIPIQDDAIIKADGKKEAGITTQSKFPPLITVDKEGIYVLTVEVQSATKFNGTVHVEMVTGTSYLSAAIYPLLPFFGVMCGAYTVLCAGWLAVCALQWRDLLRIQYWIGGVALLGMVESATYYAVYSSIDRTGYFNAEAYMFAEWVSVAKRALARMLVIIVSLGFGIVKPRLGPALQRVVGTGVLWGVLAAIEAWLRLHHKADDSNRDLLLSEAPMSLLDSAICWWVFVSLAHTMRTLQLRRNTIKLSLYRHFTNTLIFAVISSVVFMLYSIKAFRVINCIRDWKEVWMDEAYWHILFASVLTVIMVLWRPTNNNQRYAFTPLLDNADDEDDEEEEQFVNDAYGVKMRGSTCGEERAPEPAATSLDSDLRWVEENIPTSTLPLLDSDEEIINTKFEVSKMQ